MAIVPRPAPDAQAPSASHSLARAWGEGYATCAHDQDIPVRPELASPNPYECGPVDRLNDFERFELRTALGYHFNDCATADWENQVLIIETVVERMLSRRPSRVNG